MISSTEALDQVEQEQKRIQRRRKRKKNAPVTYVLQDQKNGELKIGQSTNVKKRARSFIVEHPHTLCIIGVLDVKDLEIYRRFSEWRLNSEWFYPGEDLRRFLSRHGLKTKPVPQVQLHNRQVEAFLRRELKILWKYNRLLHNGFLKPDLPVRWPEAERWKNFLTRKGK